MGQDFPDDECYEEDIRLSPGVRVGLVVEGDVVKFLGYGVFIDFVNGVPEYLLDNGTRFYSMTALWLPEQHMKEFLGEISYVKSMVELDDDAFHITELMYH